MMSSYELLWYQIWSAMVGLSEERQLSRKNTSKLPTVVRRCCLCHFFWILYLYFYKIYQNFMPYLNVRSLNVIAASILGCDRVG